MITDNILKKTREQMSKTLDYTKSQIAKVRTGRASASLLEGVTADYYGNMSPLDQMATVSAPDARTIMIQPWDKGSIEAIEKAVRSAGLGFNPQNDGQVIRIPVPPLTEERRKEFVKVCKKYAEDGKIAVRNIRRDQMDELKKTEKNKDISEDEKKKGEDEVQKITDDFVAQIDKVFEAKEKELLED